MTKETIEIPLVKATYEELQEVICELQVERIVKDKEIERLNNIINELEKYIGQEYYCFDNESVEFEVAKNILNKLKELKEKSDTNDEIVIEH